MTQYVQIRLSDSPNARPYTYIYDGEDELEEGNEVEVTLPTGVSVTRPIDIVTRNRPSIPSHVTLKTCRKA